MKMKKWLVLVALLVGAVSAQATVFYWAGDWFEPAGDGEWTTAANWYDTTIGAALAPPGAAEHVIIDENVAGNPVGNPTLSAAGGTVNILTLGWGYAGTATLNMTDGASLSVAGAGTFTRLGQIAGSTSYINMTGASSLETTVLHVGFYGDGTINMNDDAIIRTADLGMAAQFALGGTGVINMADNAKFRFDGDKTDGTAANIIAQGWITAPGAGESIVANYDAGNNWTEFTVIPEPATLSMVALMGGGMLWIRKRFTI